MIFQQFLRKCSAGTGLALCKFATGKRQTSWNRVVILHRFVPHKGGRKRCIPAGKRCNFTQVLMKTTCGKTRKEECVSMEVQAAPAGLAAKRAAWENGTRQIKRTAQAAQNKTASIIHHCTADGKRPHSRFADGKAGVQGAAGAERMCRNAQGSTLPAEKPTRKKHKEKIAGTGFLSRRYAGSGYNFLTAYGIIGIMK